MTLHNEPSSVTPRCSQSPTTWCWTTFMRSPLRYVIELTQTYQKDNFLFALTVPTSSLLWACGRGGKKKSLANFHQIGNVKRHSWEQTWTAVCVTVIILSYRTWTVYFPRSNIVSGRTNIHINTGTNSDRKGGVGECIFRFKCGSMWRWGWQKWDTCINVRALLLFSACCCFLLPSGRSDGAQRNASVQEEVRHHFAV